nr:MAG TPA: hypothetical protein [Caudoviricetes sp.]
MRAFLLVKKYNLKLSDISTVENVGLASHKASLGKTKYTEVQEYLQDEANNNNNLIKGFNDRTYHTGKYRTKKIYEPKERDIYILDFQHRVAQHALINKLEPILTNMFIKDTYACIKDRGIHQASLRTMEFIRDNDYCLKMDIRKFYPSINHDILYSMFERKFKDEGLLWLIKDIIYSFPGETNIPIGNLTSQWFGNFYMTSHDRFVKEQLRIKDYLRYCDDFLLFSNDKSELNRAKFQIIDFLKDNLRLNLSKCDLFKVNRGVDFLGYRHFRGYILLRKSTAKRIKKCLPIIYEKYKAGIIPPDEFRSIVDSYIGWAEWANAYNFIESTKLYEYRSEVMAKFSEIADENDKNIRKLEGKSVKIENWLDKPIKITAYRIEPSKFADKNGRQKDRIGFEFYSEGVPYVIFTSSSNLIYLIRKYYVKEGLECKIVRRNGELVLE